MRLLFVCSGNICRSPLAEAAFAALAQAAGCAERFEVDSAGTHGWHTGEPADPRAIEVGARHGLSVTSRARAVRPSDFREFDLILAMDRGHLSELRRRCPAELRNKIRLLRSWDFPGAPPDVPDPYYGEPSDFEDVHDIVATCASRLLDELTRTAAPAVEAARDAGA
jgi:protein-tyrosine phosphatase